MLTTNKNRWAIASRTGLSAAGVISMMLSGITNTAVAQSSESGTLEEVLVTAQRREERLQDTPISIAAFGEQALIDRGVTNLRNVTNYTPNVELTVTNRPTAGG